jgi:hypothetical protein
VSATAPPDVTLRDLLLRARAIDAAVLAQAEQMAATTSTTLVQVLVHFRVVDPKRIVRLLARGAGVEVVDVAAVEVHPRVLDLIPRHAAERLRVLPLSIARDPIGKRLVIAMSDPSDRATLALIEQATRLRIDAVLCDDSVLQQHFDRIYAAAVPVDAVVVGAVDPGAGFLTESTTEALAYVKGVVKSADFPDLDPLSGDASAVDDHDHDDRGHDDDDDTLEAARRPTGTAGSAANTALAAALAEATSENARAPRTLPTMQEVWGALTHPPSILRAPVADGGNDDAGDFDEPTDKAARRSAVATQSSRIIVVLPTGLSDHESDALRGELLDAVGAVDVDDDAVHAARSALGARALVLLAPPRQSSLLRALLDLEEAPGRPAVVILGGDPALRVLGFVTHHGELPAAPRAIAVAVVAALRMATR